MKIKFTLFLLILVINISQAQKDYTKVADEAYFQEQYSVAIDLYKKAYSKVKNKAEKARIIFQIGVCYRKINDNKNAEAWFKKAVKVKYEDPIAILYLADALKANEKYDEALIQYQEYKKEVPSDPRGDNGIESCKLAVKWKENPTRYEVFPAKQFNTKENDFSPYYFDKKYKSILFTSSREDAQGSDIDAWTGQSFSDLFYATKDNKGKWSKPQPIDEGIINTKFNEGAACLNSKFNTLYFTRCEVEKKKIKGCKIWQSKSKGRGWEEPELIQIIPEGMDETAVDTLTFGHPAISPNELILYFSSDMPGGQGGKDLWMVTRDKKSKPFKNPPINLGPTINTPGDEMFPYVHVDGTLYFASNGHIGMGGLDIFKAEPKEDGSFGTPENLKYPINSSEDDFGIIFEGTGVEKGFFTSSRKGGRGGDDIYEFILPPLIFTLRGTVIDDSTKKVIPGAIVKLIGSDGTVAYDTTDATGLYSFDKTIIKYNTSYDLTVTKEKYFSEKGKETTVGLEVSTDLVHDFRLKPIPPTPIVLPDILYALDRWELQPQYQDSLNGLYKTLIDNPNFVIELSSHTDIRGSDIYNDSLSYKRAKSVVDYLISKGIEPDRLIAKGYGERVPRTLTSDKYVHYYVKGGQIKYLTTPIKFEKGTVLTEQFINSLKTEDEREAAHQLNRRTEFRIIRQDYVSKKGSNIQQVRPQIRVVQDEEKEEGAEEKKEEPQKTEPKKN